MAIVIADNFTEAADTDLENHTPDTGTGWTRAAGVAGAAKIFAGTNAVRVTTTTLSYYVSSPEPGSADTYIQFRLKNLHVTFPDAYVCLRLVDNNNFIGWRLAGTGSAGRRLSKRVAGTITDLITGQGVDEEWIKIEASGTTVKFFQGGTGATPTWVQIGTDQTVTDHSTETSIGFQIGSSSTVDWIDDYEGGTLGGGLTAILGQPSETDTAQLVGKAKYKAIGQASATDAALTITPVKSQAVGLAAESESALPVTALKAAIVGLATETDTAQPLVAGMSAAVGLATESDSALAIAVAKFITLGLATEGDTAHTLTALKTLVTGPSTETGFAFPVTTSKAFELGLASETDSAQPLVYGLAATLGQPAEADSVSAVSRAKTLTLGIVTETEFAHAVAAYKRLGVLQPVEADSAHAISERSKTLTLGLASEVESALAVTPMGGIVVAPAVLSAPRTTYSNTQTATRSNTQTARRPRA